MPEGAVIAGASTTEALLADDRTAAAAPSDDDFSDEDDLYEAPVVADDQCGVPIGGGVVKDVGAAAPLTVAKPEENRLAAAAAPVGTPVPDRDTSADHKPAAELGPLDVFASDVSGGGDGTPAPVSTVAVAGVPTREQRPLRQVSVV